MLDKTTHYFVLYLTDNELKQQQPAVCFSP